MEKYFFLLILKYPASLEFFYFCSCIYVLKATGALSDYPRRLALETVTVYDGQLACCTRAQGASKEKEEREKPLFCARPNGAVHLKVDGSVQRRPNRNFLSYKITSFFLLAHVYYRQAAPHTLLQFLRQAA